MFQEDPFASLDFGDLNITSQDDDILNEAAGKTTVCVGVVNDAYIMQATSRRTSMMS